MAVAKALPTEMALSGNPRDRIVAAVVDELNAAEGRGDGATAAVLTRILRGRA